MKKGEIEKGGSIEELERILQAAGIDTTLWGKGKAKSIAQLQAEIDSGETILVVENGQLMRRVVIGGANIYHLSSDGKTYRLKEERQVFRNGSIRQRNLGQAVSEKMHHDEEPLLAMIRGIREELGLDGEFLIKATGIDEPFVDSPSYPGLPTRYMRHQFEVWLTEQQFNPDGYQEKQEDKTTYFVWEAFEDVPSQ